MLREGALPDEISAVGAVGGLSKVGGHELVAVDLVDSAPDRPLPLPGPHALPEHAFFIVFRGWRRIRAEKKAWAGLVHLENNFLRGGLLQPRGPWWEAASVGGGIQGCEEPHCSAPAASIACWEGPVCALALGSCTEHPSQPRSSSR